MYVSKGKDGSYFIHTAAFSCSLEFSCYSELLNLVCFCS